MEKPQKSDGFWGFACLWIFLKRFSVFCRRVSILLFEIPDELGCIGIADGITDFIELLIRGLEQFLCLLQLKITKDLGKGNAPGSEPEFSFHWIGGADTLFMFETPLICCPLSPCTNSTGNPIPTLPPAVCRIRCCGRR